MSSTASKREREYDLRLPVVALRFSEVDWEAAREFAGELNFDYDEYEGEQSWALLDRRGHAWRNIYEGDYIVWFQGDGFEAWNCYEFDKVFKERE